MKHSQPVQ
uniref:Putative disease resistance protein RGA3 n=1 Tax=Rhizophora mucronata TaxID=61149 RepID=A0A2P2MKY2_RHIMU